jgi:hypothetical protein
MLINNICHGQWRGGGDKFLPLYTSTSFSCKSYCKKYINLAVMNDGTIRELMINPRFPEEFSKLSRQFLNNVGIPISQLLHTAICYIFLSTCVLEKISILTSSGLRQGRRNVSKSGEAQVFQAYTFHPLRS